MELKVGDVYRRDNSSNDLYRIVKINNATIEMKVVGTSEINKLFTRDFLRDTCKWYKTAKLHRFFYIIKNTNLIVLVRRFIDCL